MERMRNKKKMEVEMFSNYKRKNLQQLGSYLE